MLFALKVKDSLKLCLPGQTRSGGGNGTDSLHLAGLQQVPIAAGVRHNTLDTVISKAESDGMVCERLRGN